MDRHTILITALWIEGTIISVLLVAYVGAVAHSLLRRPRTESRVHEARRRLISILVRDGDESELVASLDGLGADEATEVLVSLAPKLSGAEKAKLRVAAEQLGLLERAGQLLDEGSWWDALFAARLMTVLEARSEHALPLLSHEAPILRAQGAEWAGLWPDPERIEALLDLLDDPSDLVRFTAQDALARLGAPVVEPLRRRFEEEWVEDPTSIPEGALRVAAELGSPALVEPILKVLHHLPPSSRALATTLLGRSGGPAAVETLIELTRDESARTRAAAASALGRLQHWPAGPVLFEHLDDPAWPVRRAAALALRAIGAPGVILLRRAARRGNPEAAVMAREVLELPESVARTA